MLEVWFPVENREYAISFCIKLDCAVGEHNVTEWNLNGTQYMSWEYNDHLCAVVVFKEDIPLKWL